MSEGVEFKWSDMNEQQELVAFSPFITLTPEQQTYLSRQIFAVLTSLLTPL